MEQKSHLSTKSPYSSGLQLPSCLIVSLFLLTQYGLCMITTFASFFIIVHRLVGPTVDWFVNLIAFFIISSVFGVIYCYGLTRFVSSFNSIPELFSLLCDWNTPSFSFVNLWSWKMSGLENLTHSLFDCKPASNFISLFLTAIDAFLSICSTLKMMILIFHSLMISSFSGLKNADVSCFQNPQYSLSHLKIHVF